tara:strand:- start:473 stop:811 length:339 start_codon:yes stop_codon:yes gene_type:complete
MKNIALFIKDFKKGTEISSHLVDIGMDVTFSESIYDLPHHCKVAIIDLNEEKFANKQFVSQLKSQSGVTLIGYIDKVTKGILDDYKSTGCDIILPKASIEKNIKKIFKEILK